MILEEGGWWMIFTAVCLACLVGFLEYEGVIDLIDNKETTALELSNTADEMHPYGQECLENHDVEMHFHPYLTIIIDGDEFAIPEIPEFATAHSLDPYKEDNLKNPIVATTCAM